MKKPKYEYGLDGLNDTNDTLAVVAVAERIQKLTETLIRMYNEQEKFKDGSHRLGGERD